MDLLNAFNLVPRAARTSPSEDSTARSDSRSYHDYMDFDWSKDIQIWTDFIGLQRNKFERFMK